MMDRNMRHALLAVLALAACTPSPTSAPVVEEPAPPPPSTAAQPTPQPTPQPTTTAEPETEPEPPPKPRGTLREAKRQVSQYVPEDGNADCEASGDEFVCRVSPGYGRCTQLYTCTGIPGGDCDVGENECIPLP